MADRRRRRHSEEDSGEESLDASVNSKNNVRLSECESETEHVEPELSQSEYESTADDSRDVQETEDSDGEYETEEEETAEEESEDEGGGKKKIDEERQSGDGEEQPDENLDDDEDKKNPAYIPRKGAFYEHDMRLDPDEELPLSPGGEIDEKRGKGKLWKDQSRWAHDKFDIQDQAPKSREELITLYGYDITMDENPPEFAPRINRGKPRRGRGANFRDYLPSNMSERKGYNDDYPSLQEKISYPSQSDLDRPRRGRGQGRRGGRGNYSDRNDSFHGNYSDPRDNYTQDSRVSDRNYSSNEDNYRQRNNYRNNESENYVNKESYGNRDNYRNRDSYGNRDNYGNRDTYGNNASRDNYRENNRNRDNYRSPDKRDGFGTPQRDRVDGRGDNRRNYDTSRGSNSRGGNRGNSSRYNREDDFSSGKSDSIQPSSNDFDRQKRGGFGRQNSGGYGRQNSGGFDQQHKSGDYERQGSSHYERSNVDVKKEIVDQKDFHKSQSPTRESRHSNIVANAYRGELDRKPTSTYNKPSPKSYYTLSVMDDERSVTDTQEYDELEHGQIQKEDMRDFNVTVTEGGNRRSTAKDKERPVDDRKDQSSQGGIKHQPQLPPRLQQQQKEQQERKRQQQQQQVPPPDTTQRSNKRYSSQRQRAAPDVPGPQDAEVAQQAQAKVAPPMGYQQNFSPPKPVNPQQPMGMRPSLNQSPTSAPKGQVIPGSVPPPQMVLARGPPPPHIIPLSPRVPPPPIGHTQGTPLRQPNPQNISGLPVFPPGNIVSSPIPMSVIGSPHVIGQTVVYAAPPPTYTIPIPQFPAPQPVPPLVPVQPPVSQSGNTTSSQDALGETVRGGTTYYAHQTDVPVQGTGTTYYPPEMQVAKPNRVQIRRPKAAIPIVNPQDIKRTGDDDDIEYYEVDANGDEIYSYSEDPYGEYLDREDVRTPTDLDYEGDGDPNINDETSDSRLTEPVSERTSNELVCSDDVKPKTVEKIENEQIAISNDPDQKVEETDQTDKSSNQIVQDQTVKKSDLTPPTSVVYRQEVLSPTLSVTSNINPDADNRASNINTEDTSKSKGSEELESGSKATSEPLSDTADNTDVVSDVKQEPTDDVDDFKDAVEEVTED